MQKILVAVDGSKNSNRALERAKTLGTAFNSSITILHVTENILNTSLLSVDHISGSTLFLQEELDKTSIKLLDSYMENFKDYSGKVNTLSKSGKPANTIIDFAEEEGYDLIIIGSRGLGAFSGAMLGSVSNKVVNKSKVDVLAVR